MQLQHNGFSTAKMIQDPNIVFPTDGSMGEYALKVQVLNLMSYSVDMGGIIPSV